MENPEFIHASYYSTQLSPEKRLSDEKNGDHFAVEDLLDFPTDEYMVAADGGETGMTGNSGGSYITPVDASYSGGPYYNAAAAGVGGPRSFSSEICVPYDDVAELEWLSNIVDDSFSCEDLQKLQLTQGIKTRSNETSETHQAQYHLQPEITRPRSEEIPASAKARSKHLRAATGNWNSPLLAVSRTPTPPPPAGPTMSSLSDSVVTTAGKKSIKQMTASKKNDSPPENSTGGGEGRRCLHCATDKTPQWRTGPLGPKTLCNACGVRYKSGRLVPEYRPASSPSFVMSKHSNSHRKVMELRRQKEMMKAQQPFMHHQNGMMFDGSNGEDYLIH